MLHRGLSRGWRVWLDQYLEHITKNTAEKAVKAVLDSILDGVERDGSVSIAGFGTFERKERAARTGRNPRTGESLEIPASITVGFRPAAALKRTAVDA